MNTSDPYSLDTTDFARAIFAEQSLAALRCNDFPDTPPHPLLENPHVQGMCEYVERRRKELRQLREPKGAMRDDSYFEFNEGVMLRPEVVAMFCIEYCRAHPEVLA